MKNRVVSFLIASILAISSIGYTSFDILPAYALGNERTETQDEENEEPVEEESAEPEEEPAESYTPSEPADVKIVGFDELPEDVAYQEVKAGTTLDEIIFPDTLRIDVVPDPDREERLNRELGKEREDREAPDYDDEADFDAPSGDEEAEENTSTEEEPESDDDEVIFFDSDTGETSIVVIDEDDNGEDIEFGDEDAGWQDEDGSQEDGSSDRDNGAAEENEDSEGADVQSSDSGLDGLVGKIKAALGKLVVYAAEEPEDSEDADAKEDEAAEETDVEEETEAEDAASGDEETSDDSEEDDGVSHEMVSGIQWILDPVNNDTDSYDPNLAGAEYVFIPVLLIPDFYYIEADLPTVTIKILEDNYAFDETVEVDGVKIRVRAEEGVFPKGATLSAEKLEEEDDRIVQEAVSERSEEQGFVVKSYSFDIRILDEDEKEIEPDTEKGKVIISFETEEADNEKLQADIYHVMEDDPLESEDDVDETADEAGEMEVEKLQSAVVNGEENKAVEAVTDGFSKYMLIFSCDEFDIDWPSDRSYVCLDDVFFNSGYLLGGLIIEDPEKDIVYNNKSDSKYFYFERLDSDFSIDEEGNAVHTPIISNGCFVPSDEDGGAWYIILRKPFEGQTKKVKVTCTRDVTESTININITNNSIVDAEFVHEYPYGLDPSAFAGEDAPDFVLQVNTVCANEDGEGVLYQWQYKKNGGKEWNNIDFAHSRVFGGSFVEGSYAAGDWFRCLLNGEESKAVQIISAASDTKRTWTGSYKDDNSRYYVSNGTVAYTVDTSSGSTVIDVVGQFAKGGKAYMVQTTNGGKGWTIITGEEAAPSAGSFDSDVAILDDLYLGFSDADNLILCVEADLGSTEQSLAVGTDCAIGNGEIKDNVPLTGTLIGNIDAQKNITKVSYIGIGSRDAAQTAMNNEKGGDYPAISLVPVTTHGLRVWINNDGTAKPYRFADGTSTVRVDGEDFINVKLLSENKAANEAVSWLDSEAGGIVKFNFEIGSLATATSFKSVKDAKYEYTAKSSNIKNGKLVGDELKKYAITVADPMDSVLETMKIKTPSSVSSSLSNKAKGSTSSSSTTTSTTSSYKADFLDISIIQTSDNAAYNNKTVTEVRKDSKDTSSAAMPLKIELSYDFSGKETIKLYREHDGTVEELKERDSGADGTYTINRDAGKIYVYSYKFSQFAVAYKQEVYYTVTFDDGTSKTEVKVKAGEKVSRPADPTRDGYTFKGWYTKGTTTTSSTASATAFNFDTAITKDITLVAGWTTSKDSKNGSGDDSDNDSRAPKTGDSLPAVWLWVIILAAGAVTFVLSFRELQNTKKSEDERIKSPSKLKKALLMLGIIVSTTAKFIARKIKENKAKVLLTASGAVVIVSVIVLASTMFQYKTAEDLYIDAEETYVEESVDVENVVEVQEPVVEEHGWWDCVDVNVSKLSEDYPDVVGWIYFENEDISYPIMYSGDNDKYLSTAYTGEKAKAGAIFIDGESTPDFSDPHSLVYGHNMRDLSMFGKLRYYRNQPEYYEDHQYFQVFTKDSVYRYQIFACDVVPDNHDVFWVFGKEPSNYWKMLKEVENGSFINTGIEANESDHVITLATCTEKDDERLIVCAVRTDAYQYQQ